MRRATWSPTALSDFELSVNVKCEGKSNSGIFFHTRFQKSGWPVHGYEAQVCNGYKDPRKTGSIYSFSDIRDKSPARDDRWFNYHLVKDAFTIVHAPGAAAHCSVPPLHF